MSTQTKAEQKVMLGFWIHLIVYVLVIAGLAALNFTRNPDRLWFLWVAGGWGLGVLLHGVSLLSPEARAKAVARTAKRMDRRSTQ